MNNLLKVYCFLAISISILSLNSCSHNQKTDKPNILFIVADDLGYEKVGCYSGLKSLTPNLDRLAELGAMFKNAYASPVCTPTRMSIYTGTYTCTHKYTSVLPIHKGSKEHVDFTKWPTYAQLLRQKGYQTSVTGKWQMGALEYFPDHCSSAGFDSWCVWQIWKNGAKTKRYWHATINEDGVIRKDIDSLFGPDVLTDYVIRRMKKAKQQGKPFCIQHNMMLPHVPIIPTPDDKKNGEHENLDNMISYMDKQVGILVKAVHELDLGDNTVIVFVGDNGTQSETPRMTIHGEVTGGKWVLNDGGMHVPLIACWPKKVAANKKVEDLVEVADFFPTFCEISATPIPKDVNIDGISFYSSLLGNGHSNRKYITSGYKGNYAVFDGQWRLDNNEKKLIDCRELPFEKQVNASDSPETKEAYERLNTIMEELGL